MSFFSPVLRAAFPATRANILNWARARLLVCGAATKALAGPCGPPHFVRPMSVHAADAAPRKVTVASLLALHATGKRIAVLTAYDFPTALAAAAGGADILLVGDSLAQVALGRPTTNALTLDEMVHHTRAVAAASTGALIITDLPFGEYHATPEDAVRASVALIRAGADGVKLEGAPHMVAAVARAGIPVMGHAGLLPTRAGASGLKAQGRSATAASEVLALAQSLQDAGAFSIVLEAIPARLGTFITRRLNIPTIGIGAGSGCSGQVLVTADALGMLPGPNAKFVRRFAEVGQAAQSGASAYVEAVKDGSYPNEHEGYDMPDKQWQAFLRALEVPGEPPV